MLQGIELLISFLLGYGVCYLSFYRPYCELRDDNHNLINEWSIRTGGRTVFKPEKPKTNGNHDIQMDRGEFAIFTPSMAEAEAMESDERENDLPQMSEADFAHLKKTGVIR